MVIVGKDQITTVAWQTTLEQCRALEHWTCKWSAPIVSTTWLANGDDDTVSTHGSICGQTLYFYTNVFYIL